LFVENGLIQSNIAGLANLFAGTLVALPVVICGGGFILVLVVFSEGQTQIAMIIFAPGVLALVGLGASAILVDIMLNVRNLAGPNGNLLGNSNHAGNTISGHEASGAGMEADSTESEFAMEYNGKKIHCSSKFNGYVVDRQTFKTLKLAKEFIDSKTAS
jgi:hypothetical protein